jgi:hypothetical protein
MKKIAVFLITIPCLLLALNLTDYEVDQSSAQSLSAGLNYHFGMTSGEIVSHFLNLSLNFEMFKAKLPSSFSMNVFGNLNGNFLPQDEDTISTDSTETSPVNYQMQWEAKYNKYFKPGKDFLMFGKLDGDILTNYDYPATRATIGIGFGRFVNATPLARALRIEEEMLGNGVLIENLPFGTLLSFAKELSPETRKRFQEEHYYWEKEYYSALESILRESNVLQGADLGSKGSLIIQDVLDEYISPRYYGYEFNLGVGYDLFPAYRDWDRTAFASVSFDYARPLGFKTQFIEKSNIRLPFTGGKLGKEFHGKLLLSLAYEFSSTIDVLGTYQLNLTKPEEGDGLITSNQFSGTFAYIIVDRLVLSNTLSVNHASEGSASGSSFADNLSAEFLTTLSFRFF